MKSLEDFLQLKRMAFPRFYFLSNDEMLDILSQSRSPRAVETHLPKCFSNVQRLEYLAETTPTLGDIISVVSAEVKCCTCTCNRSIQQKWDAEKNRSIYDFIGQCLFM